MAVKKLLDRVGDKIRFKHYSMKTEKSYVSWIKHYILFHHNKRSITPSDDIHKGYPALPYPEIMRGCRA